MLRGSGSKGFQKQYVLNRKHPTLTELFKANKGAKNSKLEDVSIDASLTMFMI